MPILIVILIGWFNWLVYSAHHRLQSLSANTTSSALDYWHCNSLKYPHLYELHLLHHSIPATSAAMERHFSAAGYIVNPRRNSLADSSLEAMMMARCNRDLLLDWWSKRYSDLRGITFVRYLHSCALNDWCSHYSVTWCVLYFLFANWSSKHSIMSMSIVRQIMTSQHSN